MRRGRPASWRSRLQDELCDGIAISLELLRALRRGDTRAAARIAGQQYRHHRRLNGLLNEDPPLKEAA